MQGKPMEGLFESEQSQRLRAERERVAVYKEIRGALMQGERARVRELRDHQVPPPRALPLSSAGVRRPGVRVQLQLELPRGLGSRRRRRHKENPRRQLPAAAMRWVMGQPSPPPPPRR